MTHVERPLFEGKTCPDRISSDGKRMNVRMPLIIAMILGGAVWAGLTPHGWTVDAPSGQTDSGPDQKSDFASSVFSNAIKKAQNKCVKIYGGALAREHGYATGLLVSPDGLILTAQGIYLAGDKLKIVLPDGSGHQAEIVRIQDDLLLGLLKIEAKTPNYFHIGKEIKVRQGDWVLAMGNPFKVADGTEPLSVTLGIVSMRVEMDAKRKRQDIPYNGEALILDCITSNPGAPGGALLTTDGELAGMLGKIAESKSTNTRLNYAVPSDLIRSFLDQKPDGDTETNAEPTNRGEPWIGLRLFTMSGKRAPAYIDRIVSGSPAEKAGLKKDDLILSVDTQTVRNVSEYQKLAKTLQPGQESLFTVKRKQTIVRLKLTVQKKQDVKND